MHEARIERVTSRYRHAHVELSTGRSNQTLTLPLASGASLAGSCWLQSRSTGTTAAVPGYNAGSQYKRSNKHNAEYVRQCMHVSWPRAVG
jgi:hypothetical protein